MLRDAAEGDIQTIASTEPMGLTEHGFNKTEERTGKLVGK
jgi:hypothetical protein